MYVGAIAEFRILHVTGFPIWLLAAAHNFRWDQTFDLQVTIDW